jgi:hypothetical protein
MEYLIEDQGESRRPSGRMYGEQKTLVTFPAYLFYPDEVKQQQQ